VIRERSQSAIPASVTPDLSREVSLNPPQRLASIIPENSTLRGTPSRLYTFTLELPVHHSLFFSSRSRLVGRTLKKNFFGTFRKMVLADFFFKVPTIGVDE
jgi:hypothetical protein